LAYLYILNEYRAQYVHFTYEKWEICNVFLEQIKNETRAIFECMCYGGICSLNVADTWEFFESVAPYQWHCECTSESFVDLCPPPYGLHAQSPYVDQLKRFMSSLFFLPSCCALFLPILWSWCEFLSLFWCIRWIIG